MTQVKLEEFECIGEYYGNKIKESTGIEYVDEFFQHSPDEIKSKLEIDPKRFSQIINVLDLYRIPKISTRYAELLYYANVNSVSELSYRQAIRIFYKLKNIEEQTYIIITQPPTFAQIDEWIYYAKLMTKRIKHGLNIPIILLPMVSINNATEMQKYQIYTIQEFLDKKGLIGRGIHKRFRMKKIVYKSMLDFIDLLKIDGIDVQIAKILVKTGIGTPQILSTLSIEEISQKVQNKINKGEIQEFKKNLKSEGQ